MKIKLSVPGTDDRFGQHIEDLSFDNFCRVQIIEETKKGKRVKVNEPYFYLARREDVFIM